MRKIKTILIWGVLLFLPTIIFAQRYETVPNDPLNARIYTLDNGLKVFLTVYKEEPRIQCYIPVRVGSKNDPKETTGLAHYFEHMMFKGTPNFGTTDWEREETMIDEIESLFELYRSEQDQERRARLYQIIDSISYEASKLAIPNEYDKLMKMIGSQGTNAGTSNDYTVYMENIPSNQLENWAIIQADRFTQPVLRLFHTELETIYEEKNMSLTNDGRKANEAMLAGLFPEHPYGQQTTLGTQEHLKNPSMTNIKHFFEQYYVANNMAICLSGDFEFDEAIAIIEKYFGTLPSRPLPVLAPIQSQPIIQPIVKEVIGLEAENVRIAFKIGLPANSKEIYILRMLDNILANGKAGLIDLNINQKQLTHYSSAYPYVLCDNSAYVLYGTPKAGQTLDDVKDLLLQQLELVKKGAFEDWLLEAAINNLRLSEMRQLESNASRARMLSNAFQNNVPWSEAATAIDQYANIKKQDIVDFANRYFSNNYVIVYKRQGTPEDIAKVEKPPITPIELNRGKESEFFKKIQANKPVPIQPVFVDFQEAITFDFYQENPIYYIQNKENSTFSLTIRFKSGELNDLQLPVALKYMNYLGTKKYTPERIKELFYQYACTFTLHCSDDYSQITLSGLNDSFEMSLLLLMELLREAQSNSDALENLISDILKSRQDIKSNQNAVLNSLVAYCEYGPELAQYAFSEQELRSMTSNDLIRTVQNLLSFQSEILYYGPADIASMKRVLEKAYRVPKKFSKPAPAKKFELKPVEENRIFFTHYDANQSRLTTYSRSEKFDQALLPIVTLYNQYFGGGMNAIVFQEMRERRSLAYSATSRFVLPPDHDEYMYNYSFIATQNDKIVDAFTAFNELFDQMPQSEEPFELAKESVKTNIATNRIRKTGILNTYLRNKRLGIDYDYRKDVYNAMDTFTLQDIVTFNEQYIKGKPKAYIILSREQDISFPEIEKQFGKATKLTLEDIFGY